MTKINATSIEAAIAQHRAVIGKIIRTFSDAKATFEESTDIGGKGEKIANVGAIDLYRLRVAGLVSKDEATSILGDVFGYVTKPDGSPSKTPFGKGSDIRKRIVRLYDAQAFARDTTGTVKCPAYLEGVDRGAILSIVEAVEEFDTSDMEAKSGISIWTGYNKIGALKDKESSLAPIMRPAAVMKMVEALLLPSAVEAGAANEELRQAWLKLSDALTGVYMASETAPKAADNTKAKMAA